MDRKFPLAEIRNPNLQSQGDGGGSGGDSRGLMFMMVVVLLVVFGFDYFKPKQPVAPAAQSQPQSQTSAQQAAAAPAQSVQPQSAAAMAQPALPATPVIAASIMTATTVENSKIKIVFTNQGAQAEHWILEGKQYKDHPDPGGQQLDLVNAKTTAFGLPLSLYTYEPELTRQLNSALYQVSVSGAASSTGVVQAPCSVTFHYAANGLDVVKTFRFDESYVVTAEVEVRRNGAPVRALLAWPAGLGDQNDAMQFAYGKFIWSLDGKDDSIDAKKLIGDATHNQPYDFAGVTDLYFAAAFLPVDPAHTTVVTLHNPLELAATGEQTKQKPADVIGLAVGDSSGITHLRIFVGPKETSLLKSIHSTSADGKFAGPSLEPLIQFGWLTIIAKPLYLALRGLHSLLGPGENNWGWAIIIFTAVFNLLVMPTRFWALKSSLKMMRVQPKVDAIKARYKNLKATDPKRAEMNSEMMELYKVEGVNMYGSCLPMLPQMPLFIAYYQVLRNAVDLRQAHWLWLSDLSIFDPHYILPGIIIITMFLTQYITPTPGMEPGQRRMMAFMMPVMMGFFFGHLASGLALYMSTSGVINLALQLGINQSHLGKEMHAIAAKRAFKRGGGGSGPNQKKR
jgi:YidC/Oxa1 family membrane protein insertase